MTTQEIISAGMPIPGPGRDSEYVPEMNDQARKLCLLGFIDEELAKFFGVSVRTLYRWKEQYPAFCQAIMEGKEWADANVADSLYRRATGEHVLVERVIKNEEGKHDVITIKQFVPGEVTAQRLWLLNRRKRDWRDKVETQHTGEIAITNIVREIVRPDNQDG